MRQQVIRLVQQVVNQNGLKVVVSSGWWESFRRRHKEFSIRSAEHLSCVRMLATAPAVLDNYFDLLEETLVENGLLHKPRLMSMRLGCRWTLLIPKHCCTSWCKALTDSLIRR